MVVNCAALVVNLKTTDQVLCALQEVVGQALKSWLNENKAEVLQALRTTAVENWTLRPVKAPEAECEPKFLTTDQIAARWQLHPESVRRIVREGRLPKIFIGRRILVPLEAILDSEQKSGLPKRQ
jgi:excisionase family DNA binding protein